LIERDKAIRLQMVSRNARFSILLTCEINVIIYYEINFHILAGLTYI
jgi:hypothetical protein